VRADAFTIIPLKASQEKSRGVVRVEKDKDARTTAPHFFSISRAPARKEQLFRTIIN
jgi:hypothetical protein